MDVFVIYFPIVGLSFNVLDLIGIGFTVGVLGGFFGVGGAWIVTPALNILGFPMGYAIGTDFAQIFGKSIIATTKHGRMGNVDWKMGFTTMLGTIPGVEAGARTIRYLDELGHESGVDVVGNYVRIVYIILLFVLGSFMVYEYIKNKKSKWLELNPFKRKNKIKSKIPFLIKLRSLRIPPYVSYPTSRIDSISFWIIMLIFFFCGFISGFLGVGGGFIRMPALIYILGVPTALAIGTDLFIVMLDGAWGCFTYGMKGYVEITAAIFMLFGAAAGAQIGVTAVKYVRGYGIRLLFAIMVLFAGVSVLLKQINSVTGIPILQTLSAIIIMTSASAVCLIIIIRLIIGFRKEKKSGSEY